MSDDAVVTLRSLLEKAVEIPCHGNARMAVSIVLNFAIPNLCDRLAEKGDTIDVKEYNTILPCDIPSLETLFPLRKNGKRRVGF